MRPSSTHLIYRDEIDFTQIGTIYGKKITLPSVVPPISLRSCDIMVSSIKIYCAILNPPWFTLDTPELPIDIFNHKIIPLTPSIGRQYHISALQKPCNNCWFADMSFSVWIESSFSKQSHTSLLLGSLSQEFNCHLSISIARRDDGYQVEYSTRDIESNDSLLRWGCSHASSARATRSCDSK